jgi:hypothetical protein
VLVSFDPARSGVSTAKLPSDSRIQLREPFAYFRPLPGSGLLPRQELPTGNAEWIIDPFTPASTTRCPARSAQNGLVNVYTEDILSGNQIILLQNVPVNVAATVCGLTTNVLSNQLLSGNHAVCLTKNTFLIKSWVSYT